LATLRKLILPQGGGGGKKPGVVPSANSYFNLVGTVDIREQGGYFNRT